MMQKITKTITFMMLTVAALVFAAGCKPENGDSDVRVTTYTPQEITRYSAVCGGDVIVTQGLSLSSLGVCWSVERNPTAEDTHFSTTNWSEPYICTISGLEPGTKYHVRAYALRGLEYYYGDDKTFTTESSGGEDDNTNGHAFVDLGLPSGTLWATCNIGANAPEDYGDYFAWGETESKDGAHNWSTYKWCNGEYNQLTKYCNDSGFGYNGFTDDLTVLLPEDDAASANWGGDWRMPTREEWNELRANTTNTWTTQNGVYGRLFTASNGATLFLPAAGDYGLDSFYNDGTGGFYWSSSLHTLWPGPANAWSFYFLSDHSGSIYKAYRFGGFSVRAVIPVSQN